MRRQILLRSGKRKSCGAFRNAGAVHQILNYPCVGVAGFRLRQMPEQKAPVPRKHMVQRDGKGEFGFRVTDEFLGRDHDHQQIGDSPGGYHIGKLEQGRWNENDVTGFDEFGDDFLVARPIE